MGCVGEGNQIIWNKIERSSRGDGGLLKQGSLKRGSIKLPGGKGGGKERRS